MMLRARMQALLAQNGEELSPWLLVAATAAVVLILLLLWASLLRRRTDSPAPALASSQPSTPAAPASAAHPPAGTASAGSAASAASAEHRVIERDIQSLMKELADLTRRVNVQVAQVDTRVARLEQLIRDADQRLARLRAVQPSASGDGADHDLAPQPFSSASAAADAPSAPPDDDPDPRHLDVYALSEQGLTIPQIAERLHRPAGEVELIIALRPRRHALGSSRD